MYIYIHTHGSSLPLNGEKTTKEFNNSSFFPSLRDWGKCIRTRNQISVPNNNNDTYQKKKKKRKLWRFPERETKTILHLGLRLCLDRRRRICFGMSESTNISIANKSLGRFFCRFLKTSPWIEQNYRHTIIRIEPSSSSSSFLLKIIGEILIFFTPHLRLWSIIRFF